MWDLKPIVARVVSAALGGVFGWLTIKTGIEVDPSTQASVATAVTVAVYGAAHSVSKQIVVKLQRKKR